MIALDAGTRFHDMVCDPRTYEREIERLHQRWHGLEERGVSLARLNLHRSSLARVLARTVARGEYVAAPAWRKTVLVEGKRRVVFRYRLTDLIVHGAVAEALNQSVASCLSSRLYSYRKGTGSWTAIADFARYVRHHRRQHPEPVHRHMYVLRRDIESYTESIPLAAGAPLWRMLRRHLNGAALPPSDWRLVEQAVQPEVETPGGNNLLLDRGVPAGQPISCVLFNFYLAELDHRLEAIPGAFSARYSDDLLFAHPSAEVVRTAAEDLERCLQDLGLRFNLAKRLDLYLTGAGRPSTDWPETIPASAVPFLGAMVRADGTVSLARKKTRRFLREIRDRTERLARALSQVGARVDELGRAVCASVNQMLIPESSPFLEADAASLLRRVITDRNQLAQLDHWIARLVLRAITEDSSAKVFRRLPLRKLRQDWGLVSLEHARNRWGREVTV